MQLGDRNERIEFTVKRSSVTKPWAANAAEIEAALSLWIYHTRETERNSWNRNNFMVTQNLDPEDSEEDWLRHGETALQRQNPQFLGPYTPCLLRDLKWWTPRRSTLLRINSITPVASSTLVNHFGPSPGTVAITATGPPHTHKHRILRSQDSPTFPTPAVMVRPSQLS